MLFCDSLRMSPHPLARRYHSRGENSFFTSWYVDRILIRPCPPTKPLGAIKWIRRIHPTSTPYLASWCLGVVGSLRAIERRRLCLIGYIFRAKFGRQGDLIPWPNRNGRAKLDRLSQPKKSTIQQSTVGGLFMFGKLVMYRKGGYVCGDRI